MANGAGMIGFHEDSVILTAKLSTAKVLVQISYAYIL